MLKTITEKGYDTSKLWSRAGLYSEFTRILIDQERSKPRFWQDPLSIRHFIDNELEQALEKIAFFSLAENKILEIEKEKLVKYCETPEKKEALLNIGIILELFEDSELKIVFRHQSFQAYFAARYMYFRRPELFEQLTGDIGFFYNDVWYEVMRFFVGLEKDTEKADSIIDSILQPGDNDNELSQALSLIFAVFLASEVRVSIKKVQNLHEQLTILLTRTNEYVNFFFLYIDKFNTYNDVQRRSLFIVFISLLRNKDRDLRDTTAEALEKITTANDIPLLEPLLKDEDSYVRQTAAYALGQIGSVNDITLLEPLLRDEDEGVRSAATVALGKIGTAQDIPLLEPLLRDEDSSVRRAATEALGKIGTAEDIPLLNNLFSYKNDLDRRSAAEAVEQIYKSSTPDLRIEDVVPKREEKETLFVKTAPTQSLHILHLSDIHYALENDPFITRIFHEFLRDIQQWRTQQNNKKIHSICLTGDIAQSGQKNQYISINEKINAILNTTGCSKDNLFIIPGNHDVHEYKNISHQGKTTLEQVQENKLNIDSGVLNNFENYREFHEKFSHYYGFLETSGYVNSLTEKRSGIPRPWYSRKLQDFPVRIIGLNSALFCLKYHSQRGKIRMGTSQFDEAYFQGQPGKLSSGEVVILLTHHPIDWLEENEKDELKTLIDRYSVIHFHGHVHRLDINEVRSHSGSTYISIGTGSIYGEKGTKDINTYHIMTLDFQNQEIHIWSRRWVPELGMWTVYADNTRNIFSFPEKNS
ncbi:MAG: HEAT repeat domain-containing protein [Candidatus Aminicenantes bacterium]